MLGLAVLLAGQGLLGGIAGALIALALAGRL